MTATTAPADRRMVPLAWDAEVALTNVRAISQSPLHGPNCPQCVGIEQRVEDAALAYDLAVSIGRRWSAPSWLESVAW